MFAALGFECHRVATRHLRRILLSAIPRNVRFPPKADISQFDQIRRSVMCASKFDFRYSDQIKRVPSLSSGIGPGLSARMSPVCGSMRR